MKLSIAAKLILSTAATSTRLVVSAPSNWGKGSPNPNNPNSPTSDICPAATTAECGGTYTDGVITLGQDLVCDEDPAEIDGSFNAAITLTGNNTILDCQGYTISQTTPSIGSAYECNRTLYDTRLELKQACGLYYYNGIRINDGATVRNCNVQQFYIGSFLFSQGNIEDSDFTLNQRGVELDTFRGFFGGMGKVVRR